VLDKGYVHMLAGASGSGKTTIALQCVRRMQDDETNWLGLRGVAVAWITADRAAKQTHRKAKEIGIEIVEFYDLVGDDSISMAKLRAWLTKNPDGLLDYILNTFKKPYDLLIIDPLIPFKWLIAALRLSVLMSSSNPAWIPVP